MTSKEVPFAEKKKKTPKKPTVSLGVSVKCILELQNQARPLPISRRKIS